MVRSYVEKAREKGLELQLQSIHQGEKIHVGNREGKCIYTPGHTMGSFCFQFDKILFSGDTLFYRGYGRTDLKGGNSQKMKESLKTLFRLDPSIFVFCGHDRTTSIGYESQHNHFL
ncbi:hypothetical protein WA171_004862 [Blastocystis sp. BT1]